MARVRIGGILAKPEEVGVDASQSTKRAVETEGAAPPIGPYSQGVVADGVLYCSGQVPLDPATQDLVEGGISEQAQRCLEALDAICQAAGTRLSEAARIGIYLTDMSQFPEVNEVYSSFFSEPFPARTTIGVAALPKDALVEMDAVVPLGPGSG
jgi:2-iminobutanoate/2-iminopropanoate deaminase